jgi:hypothetical protein
MAAPRPAAATPVVYSWTGTVSFIDPALQSEGPTFAIDDPVSFVVTIDDGVVGQPLSSGDASTYNPIDTTSLTMGDSFELAGGVFDFVGSITVQDSTTDAFRIDRQALPSASFPPDLGIYRPVQVIAVLRDSSGTVLPSQALPTSLAFEDFTSSELSLIYRDPGDFATSATVGISLSDVTVAIPEPQPAFLWALMGAAFFAVRKR